LPARRAAGFLTTSAAARRRAVCGRREINYERVDKDALLLATVGQGKSRLKAFARSPP